MIINYHEDNRDLDILLYRTSSIGDVVLCTACLDFLHKLPTKCKVVWIGKTPSISLIKKFWPNVLSINLADFSEYEQLYKFLLDNKFKPHIIVNLQNNLHSLIICRKLSKSFNVKKFNISKQSLKRLLMIIRSYIFGRIFRIPQWVLVPSYYQYELSVLAIKKALYNIQKDLNQIFETKAVPRLFSEDQLTNYHKSSHDNNIVWIAVSVGAAHTTKQALDFLFIDTLNKIKNAFMLKFSSKNLGIIFLGDANDAAFSNNIIQKLKWPWEVKNFCGKLSIEEVPDFLINTVFLIANDSALVHIAEAINIPALVFFGPTVEGFGFAPHHPLSKAFSATLGCRPCSKHGKIPCRYKDKKCFYLIDTSQVCEHAIKILEKNIL